MALSNAALNERVPPSHHHGYTLLETVLAVASSGVLLLGLVSSMLVVSHAVPGGERDTGAQREVTIGGVLEQLSADLQAATAIHKLDAGGVHICRGDACTNDVAYAWSGGMIARRQGTGADEVLVEGVRSVAVTPRVEGGRITHVELQIAMDGDARGVTQVVALWNRPEAS